MAAGYEVQASWAGVSFWVNALSGTRARRIAIYGGAYRDGGTTEDLGRDPRVEQLTVQLTRQQFVDLEKAIDARRVRLFTHPLWGSFQARVNMPNYSRGSKKLITATLQVIEEKAQPISLQYASADQQKAKAKALWDDASDATGDLPDPASDFTAANDDMSDKWDDLYEVAEGAEQGSEDWTAVDRAVSAFVTSSNTVLEKLRDNVEDPESWTASDLIVRARDAILDFVESSRAVPINRAPLKINTTTDLYSLCGSVFGHYDYVQDIFDENNILDSFMLDAGIEIQIPAVM